MRKNHYCKTFLLLLPHLLVRPGICIFYVLYTQKQQDIYHCGCQKCSMIQRKVRIVCAHAHAENRVGNTVGMLPFGSHPKSCKTSHKCQDDRE